MFIINIDFAESYSIMSNLEKVYRMYILIKIQWMNMIIEYITCITKDNQIDYLHQKEQWKENVLSYIQVFILSFYYYQHYQQATIQQEGLNLQNTTFPEGLLLTNLGIPILVVCSYTEVIVYFQVSFLIQFQSSYYSEDIIYYIQKSLRSYCLHCIFTLYLLNNRWFITSLL